MLCDSVTGTVGDLIKRYEKEIFPGAGHGFLREDKEGANAAAAATAWPRSVEFLKAGLETKAQ